MNKTIYIDNLQEEQKQRYTSVDIKVLTPQDIFTIDLEDTDALIVLCELNIDKDGNKINRTDFYGVKLVQELRRNKFIGKVLFVSFMKRKDVVKGKPFNSIINTVGHSFLQLPNNPKIWYNEFEYIHILDKVELYDIVSNYCAKEGLAQQELHQLRGLLNDKSFEKRFVKEQILNCIYQIGLLFEENTTNFRENLDFTDIHQAIEKTDNYCNNIIRLNNPEYNSSSKLIKKKPWSVLFLDDEIDNSHKLISELEKQVETVYCVQNVKDAEKILIRNIENGLKISLIMSDYRLFNTKDNLKIHQLKQGYKFLMEASENYPYLGLVAFSSLSRKFLLQSFKRMGIRVDVYSKKDYLVSDTTLKILLDELIDKGDEAFDTIIRLPRISSNKKWDLFEPFYAYHRKSIDYIANEQYISNKAKTYCINYQKGNVFFNLTDYKVKLEGKKKTPDNPKSFKEFLEKMVCRRAILWYSRLSSNEPINSPKEIIKFLQGTNYNSEMGETTPTNQINTNLALNLTEYLWSTTVEEKEWLINQMGSERKKIEDVERKEIEILDFTEQEISKLKTKQKYLPNTFINSKLWLSDAVSPEYITKNKTIDKIVIKIKNRLLKTINSVKTEPSLIQILQDNNLIKDVNCKSILHQYKSLIDFYYYLTRLKRFIDNYNNSLIIVDTTLDTKSIRNKIIDKAKKEFSHHLELDLIASVYDFFYELESKNVRPKNDRAYYLAFKDFYKKYKKSFDPYQTVSIDIVSFALRDDSFDEELK